jgi:hypothetical protein
MRALLILVACASLAAGQSATADRQKAADYPVSASAGQADVGAEFLVHNIPFAHGYYFAKGYLVVDVGVFPKPGGAQKVSAGQFTLHLNGDSSILVAQSPGMVAASLKYPDWSGESSGLSGGATVGNGVGDIGINSQTRPVGRFPNDPRGKSPDDGTVNPNQDDAPDHQISLVALPDASSDRPIKGCVFFASDIKAKKIKSLALEWTGPAGDHAILKLR